MFQPEPNPDSETALNQLSKATSASKARALKALGETVCEKRILGELNNHLPNSQQQFDPYYNKKHEFAKRKLVHLLYSALGDFATQVSIRTEVSTQIGRFDITLTTENSEIAIEIKAGVSLNLSQVERYLYSGKKVVLVRIPLEQVAVLRPDHYGPFLKRADEERLAAVKRLLGGVVHSIPGPECSQCPILECEYNRFKPNSNVGRITPHDIGADLEDFSKHLYPSLEKAVRTIVNDLGISPAGPTSSSDLEMLESPVPPFPELFQS